VNSLLYQKKSILGSFREFFVIAIIDNFTSRSHFRHLSFRKIPLHGVFFTVVFNTWGFFSRSYLIYIMRGGFHRIVFNIWLFTSPSLQNLLGRLYEHRIFPLSLYTGLQLWIISTIRKFNTRSHRQLFYNKETSMATTTWTSRAATLYRLFSLEEWNQHVCGVITFNKRRSILTSTRKTVWLPPKWTSMAAELVWQLLFTAYIIPQTCTSFVDLFVGFGAFFTLYIWFTCYDPHF
jgi:hypothetical protein